MSANSMACGDPFCGSPMIASSCVLTWRPKSSLGWVLQNYHGQDVCADYTLLFGIFFGGEELRIACYQMLSLNTLPAAKSQAGSPFPNKRKHLASLACHVVSQRPYKV